MIAIRIEDAELRRILEKGTQASLVLVTTLEDRLQQTWGPAIMEDAEVGVPVEFGTLQSSRELTNVPGGFRITYGGLASEYAEKQHEDESLQHDPPTTIFSYEGTGNDGPGAWNPVGSWRRLPGTVWGKPIEYNEGKTEWRFLHVDYTRRSPRTDHPIKKMASSHWLFGAEYSAIEENRQPMIVDLQRFGAAFVKQYLTTA